jgi:hypothetical protein
MVDLMASSLRAGPPEWADMILLKELEPGETQTYTLNLDEEPVYLVCWVELFGLPNGNAGPFEVRP